MAFSQFFEILPRVTERWQSTGQGFYHPDHVNYTIAFIFNFQIKKGFQSRFHSFWTHFRRIAIFHTQSDYYNKMGGLVRSKAQFLKFFFMGIYFRVLEPSIRIKRQQSGNFASKEQIKYCAQFCQIGNFFKLRIQPLPSKSKIRLSKSVKL